MTSPTPIVLIATSLTRASDQIVRNGVRIARAAGAKIHLVHAFDLTMLYSGAAMGGGAYLPEMIEGECAGHLERLQDQAWRLGIQRQELGGLTALEGAPHRVLVETAARTGASLIVMGAAESWGRLSKLLGSTADRVVRAAACPVLALRGELELPPRRVLVAVDLSPASGDAMLRGLEVLAAIGAGPAGRRPRTAVEALYVVENPLLEAVLPTAGRRWVEAMAAENAENAEEAEDLERFIAAHLPDSGWQVSGRVRSARAADSEILGRCAEATPDLVVLGTHGRSGFERLLIGSVAESVMRHAQVSVLIIPPRAAAGADAARSLEVAHHVDDELHRAARAEADRDQAAVVAGQGGDRIVGPDLAGGVVEGAGRRLQLVGGIDGQEAGRRALGDGEVERQRLGAGRHPAEAGELEGPHGGRLQRGAAGRAGGTARVDQPAG